MGLIKISPADRKPYLFLHQLAVDEKYQNQGVGQRLLEDNYELIRNNLSPVVDTLRLTSDPFVSRNVWLYLHKGRMHSNRYLEDFFVGMEKDGGKTIRICHRTDFIMKLILKVHGLTGRFS